ncbi:GNAT family N-acetyltransferase [Candidatus Harpocratesius sp.]
MKKSEKKKSKSIEKRNPVGKIETHYADYNFDYITPEKYPITDNNEKKKVKKKQKNQNKKNKESSLSINENPFRGKLLHIFTPAYTTELIKYQAHPGEEKKETGYIPQDYTYIQMKLDMNEITEEFSKELEHYRISGIKIRKAILDDLSIFVKLYNRAFMRGSDPWSPATEQQFKEILEHKTTVVLLASIQDEDVGFIIIDLEENEEVGIICGLGTDPRWQRRGIARFLGISAWDYFKQRNVKELRCEVYEKNLPSYKLIKSLHFEECGKKIYQF